MLTLEKVRPSTEKYPKGTRLVCYEGYYGFYKSYPYHIHDTTEDGDYIVLDCDKQPVIFNPYVLGKYFKPR